MMDEHMQPIDIDPQFRAIWELAKPYYRKGRPMDTDHIEWMMREATRIAKAEDLDSSLLLPLAILHDVGYATIGDVANVNYYGLGTRKAHMAAGKDIALEILSKVNYPPEKRDKIAYYISIHDNWAFGEVDLYTSDPVLGTFKDLDYLWIYSPKGFAAIKEVWRRDDPTLDDKKALEKLQSELSPIYGKKPFSNPSTQKLHDEYLAAREQEVLGH